MSNHLLPCPACARHVRASETTCPFCNGLLPQSNVARQARMAPRGRLSRAGLIALGALAGAGAVACTDEPEEPPQMGVPVYGAPPPPEDAGLPNPNPDTPVYGAPPPPDAGPADGGRGDGGVPPKVDAQTDPGPVPVPVYGAPPLREG